MVHVLYMIQYVRDPTRFHNILYLCLSPEGQSILNIGVKGNFSTLDINSPVKVSLLHAPTGTKMILTTTS